MSKRTNQSLQDDGACLPPDNRAPSLSPALRVGLGLTLFALPPAAVGLALVWGWL